jgi:transcriptional regulator with XRE-family HTH domain
VSATLLPIDEQTDDFQIQLGSRLRRVRRSRGLTLHEVEERSDGRWKAVVVGSYELGDRAISATKLAELAAFYGVPVGELLPDRRAVEGAPPSGAIRIDLGRLLVLAANDRSLQPVLRLADHVRRQRSVGEGPALALRAEDLEALGVVLGIPVDELPAWLDERRLAVRP